MPDRAIATEPDLLPAALGVVFAEYRLSPDFRRPLIGRLILLLASALVLLSTGYTAGGDPALQTLGWAAMAGAVLTAVLYRWRGRFCTRITSEGVVACGYRRRVIPWHEISALKVRGLSTPLALGDDVATGARARVATVTVVRANGRRLLLRAPLVTDWAPDHQFASKVSELRAFWRWHTGQP